MQEHLLEEEHLMFQEAVRAFVQKEIVPYHDEWEKRGYVDRELWRKAGAQGMLCMEFPEEYGGLGFFGFRYQAIIQEELVKVGANGPGFTLHSDIVAPYCELMTEAQKEKYMPGMLTGDIITAIAMTEPGTGSDLANIKTTAIKKGNLYILNGVKTFITNGYLCDLVIVAAKTDPNAHHKGLSLLLVENGMKGFSKGKPLEKIGMKANDTCELFFDDVEVPVENLLGYEGKGFYHLMHNLAQERLSVAVGAVACCESVLEYTLKYCKERKAFGKPISSFQNSRFKLAEMKTEITIARTFVDQCVLDLNKKELTAEKAAMAKYWTTDLQSKVVDQCLQLHGGYGYMKEYPIAKAFADTRVHRIYAGTNEIMKEIIGKSMGL